MAPIAPVSYTHLDVYKRQILDGDLQRDWREGEKRNSRIVFIGRHLKQDEIRMGFIACAA